MNEKPCYDIKSLEFLNAPLDEIYHRKKHYVNGKELNTLKGILSSYFVEIERVFRYTYLSDISIDTAKINQSVISAQFPILYKNLTPLTVNYAERKGSSIQTDGLTYYFWLLEKLRNLNLHAVISTDVANTFNVNPQILALFPSLNASVRYENEGVLTVAGMIMMLLSVLDLRKTGFLVRYVLNLWGNFLLGRPLSNIKQEEESFTTFLLNYYKTDYEISIADGTPFTDTLSSIFGRETQNLVLSPKSNDTIQFALDLSDRTNMPRFSISGHVSYVNNTNVIQIDRHSNVGTFYESDYKLTVLDRESFISFCSSLPPCIGIAFLYKSNVTLFTKEVYQGLNSFFYEKLNHPKFYRDKSIETLFYGKTNADIREIGKLLNQSLLRLFLDFEEGIVFTHDLPVYHTYSKTSDILRELGVPDTLFEKLLACRNYCAHEGILNTFASTTKNNFYFSFSFICETFNDFIAFLTNAGLHKEAKRLFSNFHDYIVNGVIGSKYKRIFESSIRLFRGNREKIPQECAGIKKSLGAVYASAIDSISENALHSIVNEKSFTFYINPRLLELRDNLFSFKKLILNRIEEENLEVRGVNTETQVLEFFHTPATALYKITKNGKPVTLIPIETKTEGILEINTYSVAYANT